MDGTYDMAIEELTADVITNIANRILPVKQLNLTPSEYRIVKMMGAGMTMKDIGKAMGFRTQSDVFNRVRSCCRKNEVTRGQLIVYGAFMALHQGDI